MLAIRYNFKKINITVLVKSLNVDFGPKNVLFNKNFPQKWPTSLKITEPILVLQTKGQTDRQR